ncbi:hypothetical protein Godav_010267 [Gossypium davidsonii]|uniref:Dirigent protein n=2 Tax=Gossypium TaxID=3633 RepID=A0A7J8SFZ6_GOSDV|nr:hypothetical protein [Gossypium davidsonii]MBA0660541.1 hypothetical protein [Gossypium klotzschianum]
MFQSTMVDLMLKTFTIIALFSTLCHRRSSIRFRVSGKNATVIRVARASSTHRSSSFFGDIYVIDDPLTIKPDINSKMVGKAQGMYAYSSHTEISLLMVLNFAFTEGKYNGSTLSVLARNEAFSTMREMPIVGGTGVFRFARGYAQARTRSMSQVEAIVDLMFLYSIIADDHFNFSDIFVAYIYGFTLLDK